MRRRLGRRGLVALCLVLLAGAAPPVERPRAWKADPSDLRLEQDGNVLVARRSAPVRYATLEALLSDMEPRAASPAAVRVVRGAPGQLVDYFVCVTPDGRLIFGQQVWRLEPGSGGYVFERGELKRAYSPLEGPGTWTWLVDISVARETDVTLVVRAEADRWPIRGVTMTVLGAP